MLPSVPIFPVYNFFRQNIWHSIFDQFHFYHIFGDGMSVIRQDMVVARGLYLPRHVDVNWYFRIAIGMYSGIRQGGFVLCCTPRLGQNSTFCHLDSKTATLSLVAWSSLPPSSPWLSVCSPLTATQLSLKPTTHCAPWWKGYQVDTVQCNLNVYL